MSNLWLITKGCQNVTANSNNLQLQETLLWGLGKVIALENPEYGCRCLDLEAQSDITDSASIFSRSKIFFGVREHGGFSRYSYLLRDCQNQPFSV